MAKSKENKPFGGATMIYRATITKESVQDKSQYAGLNYHDHPLTIEGDSALEYYNRTVDFNAYHARCLRAKCDITIGLGLNITKGNETKLHDRLAIVNDRGESFQEVISQVALDFETNGNGRLEVVRGPGGMINELYFMPSVRIYERPRGTSSPFYYLNSDSGRMEEMRAFSIEDTETGSSILSFKNWTQASKFYGLPDWRGCVPDIELDYYAVLYNKKFFVNSGIPDMAIIVEGGAFDKETQEAVTSLLQSNIKGYANAHRTLYLPINDSNVKVRFERLGMDVPKDASFDQLRSRCRDNIVSGHGVYPRLVGIVTAGQLGGGGEASGQLKTFQEITINPRQSMFEQKLKGVFNGLGEGDVEASFEKMDTSIQEADSTYYPAMVNAGIITREKAREEMGYEQKMIGDDRVEKEKQEAKEQFQTNQDKKPDLKLVEKLQEIKKAM